MTQERKSEKKSLLAECTIPCIAGLYSIYYFITARDLIWEARIYSFLIILFVWIFSLVIILKNVWGARAEKGKDALPKMERSKSLKIDKNIVLAIFIAAVSLLYLISMPYLGFTLSTIVYVFIAIAIQNALKGIEGRIRVVKSIVYSILFGLASYAMFAYLLQIELAQGYIERFIQGGLQ